MKILATIERMIDGPLENRFRLNPGHKQALKKLGIATVRGLLYHFPARYGDTSEMKNVGGLARGEAAVIFGKISGLKTGKGFRTKITMAEGWVEDDTGKIKVLWFNQPYLAKMTSEGALVRVEGKVSERKKTGELYFSNPKIETVAKLPVGVGDSLFGSDDEKHALYPVYPESRGITSNWFYHALNKLFKDGALDAIADPIPEDVLQKYNLPGIKTALIWIHAPKTAANALAARKRFAFEEVFLIQLERQKIRKQFEREHAPIIKTEADAFSRFTSRFPFRPTDAQNRAVGDIFKDIARGHPMGRLLEGDVGSGKTFVAAAAAYATVMTKPQGRSVGSLQIAYMAPTEILASQHFESFISFFSHLPIAIALITSSGCKKFPSKVNPSGWTNISRGQLLKWVANGEIPILIGTHSLIQKTVKFKNLGLVVIDEQHRFGVNQRRKLARKDGIYPHLLSMTATPIPRTLALTIFGDLDLTLLDEMPAGRKPVITELVNSATERQKVYDKIKTELTAGRQVYIICPRIDEPDPAKELALQAKSVKAEAKRLKKDVFPEYEIGILHGKMAPAAKDREMEAFKEGKIKILCATSVVEVGVNVPNATVIVIEGAERFGLAQLHQLRGRVLRSSHQAYCYVFAETKTEKTLERLKALQTAKNGFELAEFDLQFRGAGELSGGKQWGVADIAMEALKNIKMVEAARLEAARLVVHDGTLSRYPALASEVSRRGTEIHFE